MEARIWFPTLEPEAKQVIPLWTPLTGVWTFGQGPANHSLFGETLGLQGVIIRLETAIVIHSGWMDLSLGCVR